jgi:SAM-dependent methyltransferase
VAELARLDLNIVDPAAAYYDRVNLELYSDDAMYAGNDRHYLECGASALQVVLAALQLARRTMPSSILDFGSGAGRVTRWLRARFPSACIDCTDIRLADLDFCHEQFGTNTWPSGTDIQELRPPRAYDVIWAGSVLTHLPEANTRMLLDAFIRWLRPNGVAVVSSIGRYACSRQETGEFTYIDDLLFRRARDCYLASGYGYSDYPGQVGYGISFIALSWFVEILSEYPNVSLTLLSEQAWDAHLDVVALQMAARADLAGTVSGARTSERAPVVKFTQEAKGQMDHESGRGPIPLPPQKFIEDVGGGDYEAIGEHLFKLIRSACRAGENDCVLDVGSGCGRVAIPFTRYLTNGTYHGFDVTLPMVEWCQQNITGRYPNFQFQHADLANTLYTKTGGEAADYTFPYPDDAFDVVFATSVFTHLLPRSAHRYAAEIARVLRRGGRALLTFFLLNDEFREQRAAGNVTIGFPYSHGPYSVMNEQEPERVLAYEESYAREMLTGAGLDIEGFSYGYWRVPGGWTFQDAFLVSK